MSALVNKLLEADTATLAHLALLLALAVTWRVAGRVPRDRSGRRDAPPPVIDREERSLPSTAKCQYKKRQRYGKKFEHKAKKKKR